MLFVAIIDLYSLIVFVAVILSWIQLPPTNPFAQFVHNLTEPALAPIRRMLPPVSGIDFSPLVLLLGLRLLSSVLAAASGGQ